MQQFSSKELYIMNGGNKLYLYKDGFGDIYQATPGEEREWTQEIIANAVAKIELLEDAIHLKFAIENLVFHNYPELEELLLSKVKDTTPSRQIAFATALWTIYGYKKSFEIIYQNLLQHRDNSVNDVFMALIEFKNNQEAQLFIVNCLEGADELWLAKAQITIGMWAYTGIPALRAHNLLNMLTAENKNSSTFQPAVERLKTILQVKTDSK
jgi:hypothetical protein